MNQETKLGLFVLIGVCALVVSIILLGDFQFQRRYYLDVIFNDIAGLPTRAKVKIAGVEVGVVDDIILEGNKAKVRIGLHPKVKVHTDARAGIMSTGLIGSKYLELTAGTPEAPLLKNGDVIIGIDPISFDKIVGEAMEQLNALTKAFRGEGGRDIGRNLAAILENLRKVSDSLRIALHEQEKQVSSIVTNLHSFSQDMAELSSQNKESLKDAIEGVKNVSEKLDRLLENIDKSEGTLGKLMADKEMGEDLKEAFQDLKETSREAKRALKRINSIETHWDYTLRYDGRNEIFRHDAGLRITPKKGKYYYLGVSNAGEEEPGVVDPEELNTFDLRIGKKYKNAQLYAGLIRSKGGIGVKVKPLSMWEPWRRLEVTAEGYHFFRYLPVNKPKFNLGMRVELLADQVYFGSQLEDPYYGSKINTYVNTSFRDEDIAYILGLIGLAQ